VSVAVTAPSALALELTAACRGKRLLVLDYDGTLAYLAVDWSSVRRDLSVAAKEVGFESDFRPLFGEIARFRDVCGADQLSLLFRVLARREVIGVDGQRPRQEVIQAVRHAMDETGVDTVVFSVNLHRTIETGLSRMGIPFVSGIVGCDDVLHWKPDPEGLTRLLAAAHIDASEAVFVGDSDRDQGAAEAAGVDFFRV